MKFGVELKLFEKKIRVLKIIWKLKSWKLNLKIGILKNYLKMTVSKIKFENWNFEKLFENESFENWNFEELFENGILKIKFENWNFGKLFENGSFWN